MRLTGAIRARGRALRLLVAAGVALLALGGASRAADDRPSVAAGPYRVSIEQMLHARSVTVYYHLPDGPRQPPPRVRRTLQVHLRVDSLETTAAAALGVFQVNRITVKVGGKSEAAQYFGGKLDTIGAAPLLRAYLYLPNLQKSARAIDVLEGEIIAYEPSYDLHLAWRPQEEPAPHMLESHGVKVSLLSIKRNGSTATVRLRAEAPEEFALVVPSNEEAHGVSLRAGGRRVGNYSTGTVRVLAPNRLEYDITYTGLRAPVEEVKLHLASRGPERRRYPFRFRNIAIPDRPVTSR